MNIGKIKRSLFPFLALIIIYCIVELCSYGIYFAVKRRFFSFGALQREREGIILSYSYKDIIDLRHKDIGEPRLPPFMVNCVIHPYIGYVLNPARPGTSEWGFIDDKPAIQKKSKDKLVIGIYGGSVAEMFFTSGMASLRKILEDSGVFPNKEIIIANMATGGYKQPQQLMILNYILAMGGEFDIIINIDGFNEVVLPMTENIPNNTFPFYPRGWYLLTKKEALDFNELSIISNVIICHRRQLFLANIFSKPPFKFSITCNVLWDALDSLLCKRIVREELDLRNCLMSDNYSYTFNGPHYNNNDDVYADLSDMWKRCSIQMAMICAANNIKYFHFLQPNQYVPGSKVMGEEELKIAFSKDNPWGDIAMRGYQYLKEKGKEFSRAGVNFYDLTMIFKDTKEPIYLDVCCHFNSKGNDIMGKIIGKFIIDEVSQH